MSIVLAFSGGLDTSFCVPHLRETTNEDVITVTANTGGLDAGAERRLEQRSASLGAVRHITVDARHRLFDDHISFLIKGNVRRGETYPLCVGTERVTQARVIAETAHELGASAIAHGSTGAGNDQVRFDVALKILAGDIEVLAPIRELSLSREATAAYLTERGFSIPSSTTTYSINKGLWGTTIGGKETLGTKEPLPDDAHPDTASVSDTPEDPVTLTVAFDRGVPVAINGSAMDPVSLIESLNKSGARFGVGRGMHVGDTILGIKGRVGYEAPAADILIRSHRELEKIVLTKWQLFQKSRLGDFYGMLLHEGHYFDPVMRDLEAFLNSSQERVTGTVDVRLHRGSVFILGCDSPFSLFNPDVAAYGEENKLWDARDARGFTQIYGVQSLLAARAATAAADDPTSS